jgi:hypothetical protein
LTYRSICMTHEGTSLFVNQMRISLNRETGCTAKFRPAKSLDMGFGVY